MKTLSSKSCVPLTGENKSVHYFDENFKEITSTASPNDIKYTYYCENGGSSLTSCVPTHQSIGGIINTNGNIIYNLLYCYL